MNGEHKSFSKNFIFCSMFEKFSFNNQNLVKDFSMVTEFGYT